MKNPENLTEKQAQTQAKLRDAGGDVWHAYTLKEALRSIFAYELTIADVEILLDEFITSAATDARTSLAAGARRSDQLGFTLGGPRIAIMATRHRFRRFGVGLGILHGAQLRAGGTWPSLFDAQGLWVLPRLQ